MAKREKYNLGIIKDPRSKEEKEKDFTYKEIASGTDLPFQVINTIEDFSKQYQLQTSSCVWQSIAKICEVLRFRAIGQKVNHSAGGYAMRSNKPGLGTFVEEGLNQASNIGVAFEDDIPSENMTEDQMNAIPYLSLISKIPENRKTKKLLYVPYMPLDFMTICKEINKGNVVGLLFRCNYHNEWNQGCPQIYGGEKDLAHEVAGVQAGYFSCTLRGNEGEKIVLNNELVIIIHDSFGNLGYQSKAVRIITKKFFDAYCVQASLVTGASYDSGVGPKPPLPTAIMAYGQTGANVKAWQLAMRYVGYFPTDIDLSVPANNRFGPLTRVHVKKLQMDNVPFFEARGTTLKALQELDGMRAGSQTLELLTSLVNK